MELSVDQKQELEVVERFHTELKKIDHEIRKIIVGQKDVVDQVMISMLTGGHSMPPEDLIASVQRTQGESQQAGFFDEEDRQEYARHQTGWWYFLLFALLAGIAEIYIANRAYSKA